MAKALNHPSINVDFELKKNQNLLLIYKDIQHHDQYVSTRKLQIVRPDTTASVGIGQSAL